MNFKLISELKKMSRNDSVYITLNVNNVSEIRPQRGMLFNKKVSFEVCVLYDFAKLETDVSVIKIIDLLEKKNFSDFESTDFENFSISSTGSGDRKCMNIEWEQPLTKSEMKEMESIDLYYDSESDQTDTSKVYFQRNSVTSMNIECTNGYKNMI